MTLFEMMICLMVHIQGTGALSGATKHDQPAKRQRTEGK